MIFVYPGGEGSAMDAQPFLHQFFEQIKKTGGPEVSGSYIPSLEEGIQTLETAPPHLGIVSLESYLKLKKNHSMELFLATLPLNGTTPEERYFLLAQADASPLESKTGLEKIYLSRPMNPKLFSEILFPNLPSDKKVLFELEVTPQLPITLKKVSQGELEGTVLLDSFEYQGFKRLNLEWTKNLRLSSVSKTIPSSPVVLFQPLSETVKKNLYQSLIKLSSTGEGRKILRNLRLRGFVKPSKEFYADVEEAFLKETSPAPIKPAESPN